jgi:hypothetical protein
MKVIPHQLILTDDKKTRGSKETAKPTTKLLKLWPYRVTAGHCNHKVP